jgi:autotransporter-associated beta strand protein
MQTPRILATSVAALIIGAFLTSTGARAQIAWDATSGANFNWSDPLNWVGDIEPGGLDSVVFPTPIPNPGALADPDKITLALGEVANAVVFQAGYTLSGGDLTLSAGVISVDPSVTATLSSTLAGSIAIAKNGNGTLVLSGSNTFTGNMAVAAGVLNIQSATALGSTAVGTTVVAGATLEIQGGITVGAEALALTGTLRNVAGNNIYGGAITINAGSSFDIATGTNLTVSASTPNTGTGAWTKIGDGTLTFTADPNNTGALTISAGVVELNHAGTIDFVTNINSGGTLRTIQADLGDDDDVAVNAGGTLDIRSGNDSMGGLSGAGLVTRGVTGAAILTANNGGETTTFSGVIENGGAGRHARSDQGGCWRDDLDRHEHLHGRDAGQQQHARDQWRYRCARGQRRGQCRRWQRGRRSHELRPGCRRLGGRHAQSHQ